VHLTSITGIGIQFYGLINSGTVGDMLLAEFVLDSTSTTTYAPPAQTSDITYNNKIYDSGPLSQGPHQLVVTPKNEHLVWIDYVLVQQAGTTSAVQATGTSANPTNSAGAVLKHSAISTGAIAGIAVAAVLAVLLLIGLGVFLRRRRRHALSKPTAEMNNENPSCESFFGIKPRQFLNPQFIRCSLHILTTITCYVSDRASFQYGASSADSDSSTRRAGSAQEVACSVASSNSPY
jgi:hypothetical protein